jgi:RNA polymerase sigma-70 factor, ECF subfamily
MGLSMDYSTLDDTDLIVAIGRYDSKTELNQMIDVLYDRFGRLVFTVAYHMVGDSETAEEITQDVFVRIYEGARSYHPDLSKVSSWVISITRHRAIDEIRRRSIRPEQDGIDWPDETGDDQIKIIQPTDGPEEAVEARMTRDRIRQALAILPEEQSKVLGLAYLYGYSHQEIAEFLGEPLGTVKSRIRMAMEKMRHALLETGVSSQTDLE